MKRVRIRVIGKVQGVFYRLYTKKKAKELDLVGWARNEADGSVLIVAEGEKTRIDQLVAWCHIGSPWANVLRVEVKDEPDEVEMKGFVVK